MSRRHRDTAAGPVRELRGWRDWLPARRTDPGTNQADPGAPGPTHQPIPARRRWGMTLFTLAWAAAAVGAAVMVPAAKAENEAMRAAPVCAVIPDRPQQHPTCLVPVRGNVTDHRGGRGGDRWLFTPTGSDGGFVPRWVRISDDTVSSRWTPAMASLFTGERVTGLYWGRTPVRFETPEGTVNAHAYDEDSWFRLVWFVTAAAALAGMWPLTLLLVRRGRGGAATLSRPGTWLPAAVLIGTVLGSFAAMATTGTARGSVGFGVVVGSTVLAWAAGMAWSARRHAADDAPRVHRAS